jgi:hypothetical protein
LHHDRTVQLVFSSRHLPASRQHLFLKKVPPTRVSNPLLGLGLFV